MKTLFLLLCEISFQIAQLFFAQLLRHISINVHSSRDILMPKNILHELDIRTGFAQPGCKGMTEAIIFARKMTNRCLEQSSKTPTLQCSEQIHRWIYEDSPDSTSFFRIFPYARSSISCTVSGSANSCSIAKSTKDFFFRGANIGAPPFSLISYVS